MLKHKVKVQEHGRCASREKAKVKKVKQSARKESERRNMRGGGEKMPQEGKKGEEKKVM